VDYRDLREGIHSITLNGRRNVVGALSFRIERAVLVAERTVGDKINCILSVKMV
jgi:hypothetical protein